MVDIPHDLTANYFNNYFSKIGMKLLKISEKKTMYLVLVIIQFFRKDQVVFPNLILKKYNKHLLKDNCMLLGKQVIMTCFALMANCYT